MMVRNRTYRCGLCALSLGRLVYMAATLGCSLYLLEAWSRCLWNIPVEVVVVFWKLGRRYVDLTVCVCVDSERVRC